jgi:hypothetical protein
MVDIENNKAVYYDGFIIFFTPDNYFTPFANHRNWVHIGCKMKQNISIFQKSHPIISSVYRHLSAPCIATTDN